HGRRRAAARRAADLRRTHHPMSEESEMASSKEGGTAVVTPRATGGEPTPLILDNAGLKIALDDVLTELACVTNHIELSPDVSTTTLTTMCGEVDYPGVTKWSLVATLYQSFDPGFTEEVLSAAVDGGVPVASEVTGRRAQPVSATNPKWSGELIPKAYAPINGDAGDVSTVD